METITKDQAVSAFSSGAIIEYQVADGSWHPVFRYDVFDCDVVFRLYEKDEDAEYLREQGLPILSAIADRIDADKKRIVELRIGSDQLAKMHHDAMRDRDKIISQRDFLIEELRHIKARAMDKSIETHPDEHTKGTLDDIWEWSEQAMKKVDEWK